MSNRNDERVLNAILNPNTPFEEEHSDKTSVSKYETSSEINEAKNLEIEENVETLESLTTRHRKEKKDLQSKIQFLKKSVTKGDKKKKKEIDAEIEKLERDFETKCQLEIKNFNQSAKPIDEKPNQEDLKSGEQENNTGKISRSQKRREKKEKLEQDREIAISLQEIQNQKGPAAIELKKIKEKLNKKGLKIKEVISDGNCMYYAISDQLRAQLSLEKSFQDLRDITCDFMLKNSDDFQPYLTNDEGDFLDSEKFQEYCLDIKNTSVWGGQLELKALSDILKVSIEIVQGEGTDIIIGEDLKNRLVITYHRHMLGSGEHYNSTEPNADNLN